MQSLRVLLISLYAALTIACTGPADAESEIRAAITQMHQALDERNNSDFREHLAVSFLGGHQGQRNMDREAVRKMLAGYFLRYRNIGVIITSLNIEPNPYEPTLASMQGSAALSGGNASLPENARLYRFDGQWRQINGRWQLVQLSWQ